MHYNHHSHFFVLIYGKRILTSGMQTKPCNNNLPCLFISRESLIKSFLILPDHQISMEICPYPLSIQRVSHKMYESNPSPYFYDNHEKKNSWHCMFLFRNKHQNCVRNIHEQKITCTQYILAPTVFTVSLDAKEKEILFYFTCFSVVSLLLFKFT